MGAVRAVFLSTRSVHSVQRVVEPELDMDRLGRRRFGAVNVFLGLVRKLLPPGQWAVHSPMRSIAREIEEAWPSSEL